MDNLKCDKFVLSKNLKNFLEESEEFKIKELQTYFPIMGKIMNFFNNDIVHQNYVLNSRFKLIEFSEKEGIEISCDKGTENYKSYKSYIYDSFEKKKIEKQIFMKQCPILDPNLSMMNQYPSVKHNMSLPYSNKYWNKYYKKINNTNNASYVDCFFTYLGSKLVENNFSPNFPLYYGSFCGIAKEFEYDLSDEYEDYKRKPWFYHGIDKQKGQEPLFSLRYIKGNQEYESESSISKESSEKENSDTESNETTYEEDNYHNIINDLKDNIQEQNFELQCFEVEENGNCINKNNKKLSDI